MFIDGLRIALARGLSHSKRLDYHHSLMELRPTHCFFGPEKPLYEGPPRYAFFLVTIKTMPSLTKSEAERCSKRHTAKIEKADANVQAQDQKIRDINKEIADTKASLMKLQGLLKNAKETPRQKHAEKRDVLDQIKGEIKESKSPEKSKSMSQ